MNQIPLFRAALILFVSGFCSLIYQTVWLREFRLIFGSSTTATAAVLAIFMAGLGIGGWILGKRVDQQSKPFEYYAKLEAAITVSTALSPFLLDAVRWMYLAIGGSSTLGPIPNLLLRLVFALLIMGPPTIFMGGTLPAAARAVTGGGDPHRRGLAILYGLNALGAVIGVLAGTFYLFELFGFRMTLWVTCLVNLLLAVLARAASRNFEYGKSAKTKKTPEVAPESPPAPDAAAEPMPTWLVLSAAFTTGFTFFLAELVWYRMTGPILGGSTYTMGIVLAVALVGIGLGGLIHYVGGSRKAPTPSTFALTCVLQAIAILIPFALGDRVALLTMSLREYGQISFLGLVTTWVLVVMVLILPAALLSGYQFPLLFSLKGKGGDGIGEDVGKIYLSNTTGAVLGSLAGGFGLIPWLGALGAWILVAVMLCVLSIVVIARERPFRSKSAVWGGVCAAVVVALAFSTGPTELWRTSPIGAGRAKVSSKTSNGLIRTQRTSKQRVLKFYDGVESALAFSKTMGLALLVNGKSDGNVYGDRVTQIMLGLVPAVLHGNVKNAFVVGLGTGQTAGWLGQLPQIESVKVAEIEPRVVDFADASASTNFNVSKHPKVDILIGDGRELLLTSKQQYDLIVSEPSNPYRAGLASFYSVDFYQSVSSKLAKGGVFAQWLQSYEIDAVAVATVIRTLTKVFPNASLWHLGSNDILIVASNEKLNPTVEAIRARIETEPYREAFERVSQMPGIEGLLAMFAGRQEVVDLVSEKGFINTDDEPRLEYLFARTVGQGDRPDPLHGIHLINQKKRWTLPEWLPRGKDSPLSTESKYKVQWLRAMRGSGTPELQDDPQYHIASRIRSGFISRDYAMVYNTLERARKELPTIKELPPFEVMYLFSMLVTKPEVPTWEELSGPIERLKRAGYLEEVQILKSYHSIRLDKMDQAADEVVKFFEMARKNPWTFGDMLMPYISSISLLDWTQEQRSRMIAEILKGPFAGYRIDSIRTQMPIVLIRRNNKLMKECMAAIAQYQEDTYPWAEELLAFKYACLKTFGKDEARTEKALAEVRLYLETSGQSINEMVGVRGAESPKLKEPVKSSSSAPKAAPLPTNEASIKEELPSPPPPSGDPKILNDMGSSLGAVDEGGKPAKALPK